MRNNHPKSEIPAMKEKAASDKEALARQKTTEAEKAAAHPHHNGHDTAAQFESGRRK
jgi:hypothetical protein